MILNNDGRHRDVLRQLVRSYELAQLVMGWSGQDRTATERTQALTEAYGMLKRVGLAK